MPIGGINTYHGTKRLLAGGVPRGYPQDIHRIPTGNPLLIHRLIHRV